MKAYSEAITRRKEKNGNDRKRNFHLNDCPERHFCAGDRRVEPGCALLAESEKVPPL